MRLVAVLAAALLVALTACGANTATPVTVTQTATVTVTATAASATVDIFTMQGTLDLIGEGNHFEASGTTCAGINGYTDIATGAPVTVYNADGKIVGAGSIIDTSYAAGACEMTWMVSGVPAGEGPYQYEISHRGRLTITEQDARDDQASASLGR